MSVLSNYAMTWDIGGATELVLLTVGQEIDAELEFPWEQAHEDRRPVEGSGTDPLPRSLVSGSISFTAYKEHANDAAARQYVHDHRAEIHARRGLRKSVIVGWYGGSATYANAMLKSHVPRMAVDPEVAKTAHTYTILFPS